MYFALDRHHPQRGLGYGYQNIWCNTVGYWTADCARFREMAQRVALERDPTTRLPQVPKPATVPPPPGATTILPGRQAAVCLAGEEPTACATRVTNAIIDAQAEAQRRQTQEFFNRLATENEIRDCAKRGGEWDGAAGRCLEPEGQISGLTMVAIMVGGFAALTLLKGRR